MPDTPGLNLDQIEARRGYRVTSGDVLKLVAALRSCQEEASKLREALEWIEGWMENHAEHKDTQIVVVTKARAALGREAG